MIISIQSLLKKSGLNKASINLNINADDTITLIISVSQSTDATNIPKTDKEIELRAALATPLVLTGTAIAVEHEICGFLTTFTETVASLTTELKSNISIVKANLAKPTKAAKSTKTTTAKKADSTESTAITPVVPETQKIETQEKANEQLDTIDMFFNNANSL